MRQNGSIVSLGGSQWTTSGSSIYYNGNVGVGTSSAPSNRLRIQLAVDNTFDGLRIDNSSGDYRIVAYTDTTDNSYLQLRNASNTTALKLDTNSNNNSFLNAGNFGIGTSSPSYSLDVQAILEIEFHFVSSYQ